VTRRRIRWFAVLLLVTAVGFLLWLYTRPDPVEVTVKPVTRATVERIVANTRAGTVNACRRAKLSPSIGGQISQLLVQEGYTVHAGQLLLELWNKDLKAEVALASGEVQAAAATIRAACLKAEVTQREANRLFKLRQTGAASEERTDRAVTEAKVAKAECEAAKASADTSVARLDLARAKLERTRLTAPFDGVIAEINGELNEYVTPSPVGIATPPAVDLIDNSCFYVTAPIDEVDAPAITVAMPARVSLDAFGNRIFESRVRRIADYVLDREKQARTVDVEVEFVNPEDKKSLLAGYSADVEVILEAHHDTLCIPTQAVLDGKRVFVYLRAQGRIEERNIQSGISNWDLTEVLSGLAVGDLVVVSVDRPGLENGAPAVVAIEEQ
jgi:HlyD family secretion protein